MTVETSRICSAENWPWHPHISYSWS